MKSGNALWVAVICVASLVSFSSPAQVRITEFMAANTHTLADENGSFEDWIEVQNNSSTNVNLFDWSLTDNPDKLTKWRFPATNLPPGGFLVVFASNKDRRTPGAQLHTNFKLDASGEYLALVDPTGTNIVTEFSPTYPPQVSDVSYGFTLLSTQFTLVSTGAAVRVLVPSVANGGNALDYAWTGDATNEPFNDNAWQSGTTGIGFSDGSGGVNAGDIGLDIQSGMLNSNASAFVRLPFVAENPADVSLLTLRIKYNDGYAAWINGVQVASANAPEVDLTWDSSATATHSGSITDVVQIGNAGTVLRPGTNILAIQGLNIASNDGSFLVLPGLDGVTVPSESTNGVYFLTPTPGAENIGGSTLLGPGIADVSHTPNVPLDDQDLVVTARVFQTLNAVSNVTMHYRIMYGAEVLVPMFDDGAHGDGISGDGVFGATIPASASTNGQMIRYYVSAQDVRTNSSRWPLFTDPAGSAQYLGTIVNPTNVTSKLPIFHLFIASPGAADMQTGTRASFFYDNEFYDNIAIQVRGNTTANYTKKSHRLEFNKEHPLRHPGPGGRIRRTSLMAEFADPSYLRQHLSFWLQDKMDVPAPFDYPVHVRLNGAFWQLAFHNDVLGEDQQERLGYDPNGSLYKAAGTIQTSHSSTGGFEKLLPKINGVVTGGTADFDAMATAISESRPAGLRKTNIFDILNLPEIVNYLAVARFCQEGDDVWANMSVHRDTFGSQEWSIIPFDLNVSWGQLFWSDNTGQYGHINATDDFYKSHPLYGGSQIQEAGGGRGYNRIYDVIISVPETRQMLLRRMRTMMDTAVQPLGTPYSQDIILQHITTITNQMWAEAFMDRAKWGWPPNSYMYGFGPNQWLTNGVNDLINQFINPRRQHFFYTHCVVNTSVPVGLAYYLNAGIPTKQPADAVISITGFDYNPVSANQDEEYVRLTNSNPYAVDISGWKLEGGIDFTFHPGTVMSSNSVLYVSPNVRAFRARTVNPRGAQGLFVQGNYSGRLNAWGETLTLTDNTGRLVSTNGFVGNPSPAQRYLRVTEIMYNPSPLLSVTNDEQQFEFIELKNISTNVTINMAGVRFTNGIHFNFTGSAVTSLLPQQTVLLVRSQTAFTARYGGGFSIAGQFTGALDNGGETLRLEDAVGEKILEFAYNNSWYPITDGLGFSLVIVDENALWSTWGDKVSWRDSGALNGSPGLTDPAPPVFNAIIVNEALTHTDLPQLDSVELFNPTTNTVNIGGWFLTDDFYTPKKYRIPNGTTISPRSYLVFNENQFNTGPNAFRFSELGEFVYLLSGDANTNLSGYWHGYEFGEAPNGVSFGRYTNSQTNVFFTLQSALTLGTNNAYPRVGPIVISEIMYRPPDLAYGVDNDLDEFIELQNITGGSVPLYDPGCPANTWRLRNAVDFDFPPNQTLAAAARLLVVGFSPTNTTQLTAFRTKYGISNSVAVYGPWTGKLDNSRDTIELKQPETPETVPPFTVPFIMIDKVAYTDEAPWPTGADGIGNSLQRVSNTGFGNDPTNWFAAGVTAGRATVPDIAPTVSILSPANGTLIDFGADATVSITGDDPDGFIARVQLLDGETVVTQWSHPPFDFVWTAPPTGEHHLRAVATDNVGGIAESSQVTFTVPEPPVVMFAPPGYSFASEGSSGITDAMLPVILSPPAVRTVTVAFATANGTAVAGTDYIATNGVLTFAPGQTNLNIVVQVLGDGDPEPDEYFTVTLANVTNAVLGSTVGGVVIANDDFSSVDYFTEMFDTTTNDLAYRSFTFTPDGSTNFYSVCRETVTRFPTDPAGGTAVTLTDDSFIQVTLPGTDSVAIYNRRTNVFFIGSNGYLTMGSGDTAWSETLSDHFNRPRVSALFDDLYPPSGGTISWKRLTNRVAVTWLAVPEIESATRINSFQIEMFFDGRIRLTYLGIKATDGLAGLSAGQGLPPGLVQSDFSSYGLCSYADTDGDGMPDLWELANGTNPLIPDANADPDQDGMSSIQEFLAGTNPTNAASVLKIESATLSDTNLILSFTGVSNHSYTILSKSSLESGSWQKWQDAASAPSNRAVWLTNTMEAATNRYFRLVTPLQP